jgi:large subunit ribosomal protein L24
MKQNNSRSKKIRRGDKVVVTTGTCKGQSGTVLRYEDDYVVVQGLNLKKKHVKPSEQNPKGGILEIEAPIHVSNVCVCDENGAPLKLKLARDADGQGQLYYMKDNEKVIYRQIKSPK